MAGEVSVRAVQPGDRAAWEPLWQGYLTFYKATLAPEVTDATWRRFFDPMERLGAFVAERDAGLMGIPPSLQNRSPWAPLCYFSLEALFVDRAARGGGGGRALTAAGGAAARRAGASRLYWMTHETNATAQKLYNQVAERPGFV